MTSEQVINTIVPYCERLSNGDEPFNTITNTAFLLVAAYNWYRLRQIKPELAGSGLAASKTRFNLMIFVSCALPAMIGIGSALFHATPSTLTHMLDIVPVCLFALGSLLLLLSNKAWPVRSISMLMVMWLSATAIAAQWPEVLAHSLFYLPTVLVLLFLALVFNPAAASHSLRKCSRQEKRLLILSATTFTTALLFRATDLPSCIPWSQANSSLAPPASSELFTGVAGTLGTHFLWHLLTALVCYLIAGLLIASYKNPALTQQAG